MSTYIHFTEEQKEQARQTDLVELLRSQGEKLKPSGHEFEWRDGSAKVTVRGNLWFHQCTDPLADIEKDDYVEEARQRYGASGARDVDALLRDNAALFAGGELSQEEKDAFFEAVMRAYVTSKDIASVKFGRKK